MVTIDINAVDPALRADLGDDTDGWQAYETPYETSYEHFPSGVETYHIVWSHRLRRGGITLVGSGSSGHCGWTDAGSPEEVLQRFVTDCMTA